MENERNELIEHTIQIDNYTELTLKIPKVLTAIELKSLMFKANKIFNLSDVPLQKPTYSHTSKHIIPRTNYFNAEMDAKLYKYKKNNTVWKVISEKMNISVKKLNARMSYLKMKDRWNDALLKGAKE